LEGSQIVLANIKDRPIVVMDHRILVGVDLWPLLKLELEVEDLTLKQRSNLDSLFYQNGEVLSKQEERDVIILELNDVVDDHLNSP
jgi:hypothetical protein